MTNTKLNSDTPLAMMTIGQLLSCLNIGSNEPRAKQENTSGKSYVYGLKGIMNLFNVCHATAQKYKDGILKDAIMQSGRKIVVDVEKAMQLFNESKGR